MSEIEERVKFVLFSAKWCSPCQFFKKNELPALKRAYPIVKFSIVDIDKSKDTSITSIPTVRIYQGTKLVKTFRNVLGEIPQIQVALDRLCV